MATKAIKQAEGKQNVVSAPKFKFGAKSEKQEKFFQDQFEKVRNDIEKLINDGTLAQWEKTWCSTQIKPLNFVTTKAYSGLYNYMILEFARMAGGYESSQWAGISQIKDVGGRVKQEEIKNGHPIFVPRFFKKEETNQKTGRIEERLILTGFNVYSVYNFAQCESVDDLDRREKGDSRDIAKVEDAETIINQTHAEIRYGHDRAAYSPSGDYIVLPRQEDFKSDESFYSTLFHEITHWSGASDRLHRFNERNTHFGSEEYSKEELVAEFGASMLKARCGIDDGNSNAAAYIKSWWSHIQNDVSEMATAFVKAGKAVEYICDEQNFL